MPKPGRKTAPAAAKRLDKMGLTEQAAFLRSVLESSTEYSIVAKDLKGLILAWNEGARRIYGYEPAEVLGQSAFILHDPADVESGKVQALLDEVRQTGLWSGPLNRVRKDGSRFHAYVTITLRRDRLEKPVGFTMISRDVTEFDRIERALAERTRQDAAARQQAEGRFRAAVESAPNGMVMIDSAGTIVLVNREIERLFGYPREELLGKLIDALVPERFRGHHPAFRADFFARPGIRAMGGGRELFGLRKDGTEIPVEIGLNPLEDGEGKFVLASVVDITARKQADARFRAAVESAPNGMVMIDRSGKIVLVNREIERLFGYTRAELLGESIELLVPARLRGQHPRHRDDFFARPQTRAMGAGRELFGVCKDGTEIAVEIGLNPIDTDEGLFVLASVVDITQRKQGETELKRSNEELERFAYVASHDLQEPLRMVGSYVQLLAKRYKGRLDSDADDYIGFALDGALRMQRLIEDLLAFSRVGTKGAALVPTDANVVLESALANLALAIGESGASVTTDPLPTVRGDAGQLEHVFLNLISNALKFRGSAPPLIHVGAVRHQDTWRFTVRDNGIGIEPQYFERIFVIFQRLNARSDYPGTGIGLAIVKKIVERHGGRITVESVPGAGTTFSFTLPAVLET